MNEDALTTFCTDTLDGQRLGEWTVYWDFPGFVHLCPDAEVRNERNEGASFIATPDFTNGELDHIVFAVDFFGRQIYFADEVVVWETETALATWRAAVEKRMPLVERCFAVLRGEGDEETKAGAIQEMVRRAGVSA